MKHIGILSDTHGTLSRQVLKALEGADMILHAGDVGNPQILDVLRGLAPVAAVRGNTDAGQWASELPLTDMVAVGDFFFYMLHDVEKLDLDPSSAGVHAVISGHTHRSLIRWQDGVLCMNPGSASQARHGGGLSVGRIRLVDGRIEPEIITVD